MFGSFFDKLSGLFDTGFIVAFWAPVFIGLALLSAIFAVPFDLAATLKVWTELNSLTQLLFAVTGLVSVTVLAYVTQMLALPVIRLYEGYSFPSWLAAWAQQGRVNAKPTRLGDTLAAAEKHPLDVIKLDSILWYPRLYMLLPDTARGQIDGALLSMIGLLNLCTVLVIVAFVGGGYLVATDTHWWLFVLVFIGALLLARVCYEGAVNQAHSYGDALRAAFDLYRHEILKQMGIFVPDNLDTEWMLWKVLNDWIDDRQHNLLPHHQYDDYKSKGVVLEWLKRPFYYAGHAPEPSKPTEMSVEINGDLQLK